MQDITRGEVAKLVAKYTGHSKKDCAHILDTYYIVVKEALLAGLNITIPGVCSLSNTQVSAKESREYYSSLSDKNIVTTAHEAYNKPYCRFKPGIRQEMRDRTEGKVF